MKYLKKIEEFNSSKIEEGIENVNIHKAVIKNICELKLPDPEHGDLKLSVFPFENTDSWVSLPEGFKLWEKSFNEVIKMIPLQENCNTHYVTIDTKFFTKDEYLRREGIHADGNFCVDPKFTTSVKEDFKSSWGGAMPTWGGARYKADNCTIGEEDCKSSWGGAKPTWGGARAKSKEMMKSMWGGSMPTWGGARVKENVYEAKSDNSHVQMDWVLPYNIVIPVGDYISNKKGGILTVSTEVGCQGWQGTFKGEILSEGAYTDMETQLTDDKKIVFEKDSLYFMTSNTPHETLLISKGKRRTFMRITLNHNYSNEAILNNIK